MYLIGDENDLIKLRANIRKDEVRMYPMKVTKEQMQKVNLKFDFCQSLYIIVYILNYVKILFI
ncbi:MAG: hypothetical protein Q9M97_05020 [Candidatus Gracilibacteria bacterium]|nr:hypothetical protein [Candidatus Gracilibacteria bacterium]